MDRLFAVCLAGALGTGCRYLVGLWTSRWSGPNFPIGTLLVNLVGCFLMGVLQRASLEREWLPPSLRVIVGTGFLGGLTTYSSFNFEVTWMAQQRSSTVAAGYYAATALGCILSGLLGSLVARR